MSALTAILLSLVLLSPSLVQGQVTVSAPIPDTVPANYAGVSIVLKALTNDAAKLAPYRANSTARCVFFGPDGTKLSSEFGSLNAFDSKEELRVLCNSPMLPVGNSTIKIELSSKSSEGKEVNTTTTENAASVQAVVPSSGNITAVNPREVPASGGARIDFFRVMNLNPRPLQGTLFCLFNNRDRVDAFLSSSMSMNRGVFGDSVFCITPPMPNGTATVQLVHASAEPSPPFNLTVEAVEGDSGTIVSVSPTSGATKGGTFVIVHGSGFGTSRSSTFSCIFRNTTAPVGVDASASELGMKLSPNMVRCMTPPHLPGTVKISVKKNNLLPSNEVDYSFAGPDPGPISASGLINLIVPAETPFTGGVALNVYGAGFGSDLKESWTCVFGDLEVDGERLGPGNIRCIVPPTTRPPAGESKIVIDFSVKKAGASSSNALNFTYTLLPTTGHVAMVSPLTGSTAGGTEIDVRGEFFPPSMGAMYFCIFGDKETAAWVLSRSQLRCTSPRYTETLEPGKTVSVPFHVRRSDADSRNPEDNFQFTYTSVTNAANLTAVHIDFISPSVILLTGGPVSIVSTSLPKLSEENPSTFWRCKFGEMYVAASRVGGALIKCEAPPQALPGKVPVSIHRDLDLSSNTISVTYIAPPTKETKLKSIMPDKGTQGTVVSIICDTLDEQWSRAVSASLECVFGNVISPAHRVGGNIIECAAPAQAFSDHNLEKAISIQVKIQANGKFISNDFVTFTYLPESELEKLIAGLDPSRAFVAQKTSPAFIAFISAIVWIIMTFLSAILCCFARNTCLRRKERISLQRDFDEAEVELGLVKRKRKVSSDDDNLGVEFENDEFVQ